MFAGELNQTKTTKQNTSKMRVEKSDWKIHFILPLATFVAI